MTKKTIRAGLLAIALSGALGACGGNHGAVSLPAADPDAPGASIICIAGRGSPLVLGVPHAGRTYPDALIAAAAAPVERLSLLEDRYADQLIGGMLVDGAAAVVARHARAWMDLNRDPGELAPMTSVR